MMQTYARFVIAALSALALFGCGTITPLTTQLSPTAITLAKIQAGGILPANCNDWTSSWLTPEAWWNSQLPTQPPRFEFVIVGFEILFDVRSGCSKFRQDLYRAGFSYNLAGRQNLKGLVTKAELTFQSATLPSGVNATSLCQPLTGGGGSLLRLAPSASLPTASQRFAYLGSGPSAQSYPASGQVFGMTFPWISGTVANGVTTSPTGQGTATFTVDVTNVLTGAIDQGDAALAFMISGSDETIRTVFPSGPQDCRTAYKIGNLVITHL